jgi:hypothetical protein
LIKCKNFRLLLSAVILFITANAGFTQNLDKEISINVRNFSLENVLKLISRQGGIFFSYSPQAIPIEKKISIRAKDTPVRTILDQVLLPNGIDYFLSENQVILKPHRPVAGEQPPENKLLARRFTISGYVRDSASGEVIIGANVYDKTSMQGAVTNGYGFYSLTLPEGIYMVAYSFVGYSPVIQYIELSKNRILQVNLTETRLDIKEVEIVSDLSNANFNSTKAGEIRFSPGALKQIPGFAGNIDVIKTLQTVPGIVAFGDGSTFYYVRGGNSDQNLLVIDEAPIYNPSHLFGFFSALAPDAIKDVQVYKGDFPANYGGRLSSVVDVKARDGNLRRFGFAGNIGPFTTDFTLEGPILKDKSAFIISGRKSNLNWLNVSSTSEPDMTINFYDLNAKLNLKLSPNNRIFLTSYAGNDDFSKLTSPGVKQTFGISWKNSVGTLRWNHIFSNRLFSNTTFCYSRYNYYLYMYKELNDYWNSAISNATLKTDFSWYPNPRNTVKAGIEVSSHFSNPGNVHYSDPEIQKLIPEIPTYKSVEYVFYLSNEQELSRKLYLRYGLRVVLWQDLGPASVYFFDANHNVIDTAQVAGKTIYSSFINPEPRLSLTYLLTKASSLKFTYNRTVQYLQVLSNSTSPFTSLEVWAPSGPNINPQKADQLELGYFHRQPGAGFDFSVETFYKRFYNQVDYKDHANMLYNPLIEGQLRFGKAWSYGVEILLRKTAGNFTGWIGYSYSRSFRQIEGINNNETFRATYDRPNNICLSLSFKPGSHWDFSAHWVYLTGSVFSAPTGFYYLNGYSVPIYGDKNNDRLPDYHRMDLSVAFLISKPGNKFRHSLILTMYNAYGRHNPFSVNFNKMMNDNGDFVVPVNINGDYELVPTSISVAGIIPSVNYTFRF